MSDQPNGPEGTSSANNPVTPQQPTGTTGTPPPEDYKRRFDGAILKIQELTLKQREVEAELAKKASEFEQLQAQLGIKDVEKLAAVGERDKQLQQYITKSQQQETELKNLKALELKVKVAKKLNRPELLKIIDRIPALEDEETLEVVMKDFLGFADELVASREQQLLAGVTPGVGVGAQAPAKPSSGKGWEDYINGLPLGSKDRVAALNEYGDWLEKTNNPT